MKEQIINDLMNHHRRKVMKEIEDITDSCFRVEDDEEAARTASAYIVIRVALVTSIATAIKNGANKAQFLEVVNNFWTQIISEMPPRKRKPGDAR
jgi:hypothetical protein